ncbi:MAG TPA: hypothetical protein DEP84_04030 [Chloroflexi bacterium]|nr:hypothetical protein [Chloroflexota bacterium]
MIRQAVPRRLFWRSIWALARRDWLAAVRSPVPYIAALLAALVTAYLLSVPLSFLGDYGLLVATDPLVPAFSGAIAVTAIYTAIAAVTAIIQEREQRTLRVLFYTPITETSLILAKFAGVLLHALTVLLIACISATISAIVTRFALSGQLLWTLPLSLLLLADMAAFGLALSASAPSTRTAVFGLVALLFVLFGLQLTGRVAEQVLPALGGGLVAVLAPVLNAISAVTGVISPLAYLLRGLQAVALGNAGEYASNIVASIVYTAVLLALAVRIVAWRGVSS